MYRRLVSEEQFIAGHHISIWSILEQRTTVEDTCITDMDQIDEQLFGKRKPHFEDSTRTSKEVCTSKAMKTKTGKAVEVVVGNVEEVQQNIPTQGKKYIDKYKTCLAKVQVIVLQATTSLSNEISTRDKILFFYIKQLFTN